VYSQEDQQALHIHNTHLTESNLLFFAKAYEYRTGFCTKPLIFLE